MVLPASSAAAPRTTPTYDWHAVGPRWVWNVVVGNGPKTMTTTTTTTSSSIKGTTAVATGSNNNNGGWYSSSSIRRILAVLLFLIVADSIPLLYRLQQQIGLSQSFLYLPEDVVETDTSSSTAATTKVSSSSLESLPSSSSMKLLQEEEKALPNTKSTASTPLLRKSTTTTTTRPKKTMTTTTKTATSNNKDNNNNPSFENPNSYMRACIFVRNDNFMLSEWIAYHYVTLPLRHVIIGLDENVQEDPLDVLRPYSSNTSSGLHYEVWPVQRYFAGVEYKDKKNPLWQFRQRQPHFMSVCLQYLYTYTYPTTNNKKNNPSNNKQKGGKTTTTTNTTNTTLTPGNMRGWVALVDTDEYIRLNPLDDALDEEYFSNNNDTTMNIADPKKALEHFKSKIKNKTAIPKLMYAINAFLTPKESVWDRIVMRKQLRQRLGLDNNNKKKKDAATTTTTNIPSVLQVLEEYSAKHGTRPCHSFSRLRFSAVRDNHTELMETLCRPSLQPGILESLGNGGGEEEENGGNDYEIRNATLNKFITLRYLYHAYPGDWKHNEWAKSLVDLRQVPSSPASLRVTDVHRPLKQYCTQSYVPDLISFIHANHYVNEWSVFGGREGDVRRKQHSEWDKYAHEREYAKCDQMYAWIQEFVTRFGPRQAKLLLTHVLEQ